MKEQEAVGFVKRVGKDIQAELTQRMENCNDLKVRLQNLMDLEKHLVMAIDGVAVQNEIDLENLK